MISHDQYNWILILGMEKDKYFNLNRCVNYNKSEFAKEHRKMYLTTTMSKIGLPLN